MRNPLSNAERQERYREKQRKLDAEVTNLRAERAALQAELDDNVTSRRQPWP